MQVTGTHINYYFVCQRKLWLFANSIQMEQNSELVSMGKLIHESSYTQRALQYEELELDGIKVDYFDAKRKVIHEIKKSPKLHTAHLWQVKYYIYVMEQHGIEGVSGILEYPKERKTEEVLLSEKDRVEIATIRTSIENVIYGNAPEALHSRSCGKCAYFDFCFSDEE